MAYYEKAEHLSLIKKPPPSEPAVTAIPKSQNSKPSINELQLINIDTYGHYRFCYYYIYGGGFKSTTSQYSKSILVKDGQYNTEIGRFLIEYNTGGSQVEKIVLCYKRSDSDVLYRIREIDKENNGLGDNEIVSYEFVDEGTYIPESDQYSDRLYDNIPQSAKHMEYYENVLSIINYELGYDFVDEDENSIEIDAYIPSGDDGDDGIDDYDEIKYDVAALEDDPSNPGEYNLEFNLTTSNIAGNIEAGDVIYLNITESSYTDSYAFSVNDNYDTLGNFMINGIGFEGNWSEQYNTPEKQIIAGTSSTNVQVVTDVNGNRFIYMHYTDISMNPIAYIALIKQQKQTFTPRKYLKYKIQYFDEYNRSMGCFDLKYNNENGYFAAIDDFTGKIRIYINHNPPYWATKYNIVRGYDSYNYKYLGGKFETVYFPSEEYVAYLYLEGEKLGAISENGKIVLKIAEKNQSDPVSFREYSVESVEAYDADELYSGSPSGTWAKVKKITGDSWLSALNDDNVYIYYYPIDQAVKSDLVYEVPDTLNTISIGANGNLSHNGNLQNQITGDETPSTQPAIIQFYDGSSVLTEDLPYDRTHLITDGVIDVISLKNIEDGYTYENVGRPSFLLDQPQKETHPAGQIVSQQFLRETNFNGLNQFDTAQANFYDYNINDGEITAIKKLGRDIVVFQNEGKITRHDIKSNTLVTQDGEVRVQIGQIFGTTRPYLGDYSLSDPFSLTYYNGRFYFVDTRSRNILQLAPDGITELADKSHLLRTHLKQYLTNKNKGTFKGGFDPERRRYILTINGKSYQYDLDKKLWISPLSPNPDHYISLPEGLVDDNDNGVGGLYSLKGGKLYKHYSSDETQPRAKYYATQKGCYIEYIFNQEPYKEKVINGIYLDSDKPLDVTLTGTGGESVTIEKDDFEQVQTWWYAPVPGVLAANRSGVAVKGLGVGDGHEGDYGIKGVLTFSEDIIDTQVSENDTIKYIDDSGAEQTIGQFQSKSGTVVITKTYNPTSDINGRFMFAVGVEAVEGDSIHSDIFTVKLELSAGDLEDAEDFTLYGVNFEIDYSEV